MSVLIKRKRGRPRLDESRVINDFDFRLMEAFKKHPIFYNKNYPNYRNRERTEYAWENVANGLNVSVTVVKNRVLQLRNRYNVEKRRVDVASNSASNWPLFDSLRFISEYNENHTPGALASKSNIAAPASSSSDAGANEYEEYEDEDMETETKLNNINNQRNGYITSDNIEYSQQPDLLQNSQPASEFDFKIPETTLADDETHFKKFHAFGEFLASSLIELNEMQALHLVKKFTADLVEYSKLGEGKKVLRTTVSSPCGNDEDQIQNDLG